MRPRWARGIVSDRYVMAMTVIAPRPTPVSMRATSSVPTPHAAALVSEKREYQTIPKKPADVMNAIWSTEIPRYSFRPGAA